jgi:hypothetical protein
VPVACPLAKVDVAGGFEELGALFTFTPLPSRETIA